MIVSLIACFWWGFGITANDALFIPNNHLWGDQRSTFTNADPRDPYAHSSFVNPPWVAVFLFPLTLLPLPLAVLLQLMATFILLTLIIERLGGNNAHAILCLTSFFAFDLAFELNIDWLTYLGLLVSPFFSGIFILAKPQIALGFWLTCSPALLIKVMLGVIFLLCLSGILWGSWIGTMWNNITISTLNRPFNIAPLGLLPAPLSLGIGVLMGSVAHYRRDAALSILAWMFFVPYLTFYSFIFYFAVLLVRFPILGKIVYVCTWVIYGGALLIGVWMI